MKSLTLGFALFSFCLILQSCAADPGRSGSITILDFRARNVERLHAGLGPLLGDDSVGRAAMAFVAEYERELASHLPRGKDSIAALEPGYSTLADYLPLGYINPNPLQNKDNRSPSGRVQDPQTRRLLDYLNGRRMRALADLRKHHDAFGFTGDRGEAKWGLVNGYIAVTAAPSPNDVKSIGDLVEPLLAALKAPDPAVTPDP